MPSHNDNRADWIHKQLGQALHPTHLEIIDQGWQHIGHLEEGAGHFKVIISSPTFTGLSQVDCHRLVYETLGDVIGKTIHALQIEIR